MCPCLMQQYLWWRQRVILPAPFPETLNSNEHAKLLLPDLIETTQTVKCESGP